MSWISSSGIGEQERCVWSASPFVFFVNKPHGTVKGTSSVTEYRCCFRRRVPALWHSLLRPSNLADVMGFFQDSHPPQSIWNRFRTWTRLSRLQHKTNHLQSRDESRPTFPREPFHGHSRSPHDQNDTDNTGQGSCKFRAQDRKGRLCPVAGLAAFCDTDRTSSDLYTPTHSPLSGTERLSGQKPLVSTNTTGTGLLASF